MFHILGFHCFSIGGTIFPFTETLRYSGVHHSSQQLTVIVDKLARIQEAVDYLTPQTKYKVNH